MDETDDSEATQPDQITPKTTQELHVPIDYPYTIFKSSLQNFKNPIRCCCHACVMCPLIETRCFAESTTLEQKYPIMLQHPKQFFNCKTKIVIILYLIICTTPGCRAQYVGYTTRCFSSRVFEHLLTNGPMINHMKQESHEYKRIRFQILAQSPTNETNKNSG